MKANLSRMLRSGLALLLVFCMVAGFVPTMAFATSEGNATESTGDPNTINYVSIGDSMANGYGMIGYNQNSNDRNKYDFKTGYGMYGNGAYPNKFATHLAANGTVSVNHIELATSGMIAPDLLYVLGGVDVAVEDAWAGYQHYVGTYTDSEVRDHFQSSIKDADVISLGIGNGSFGAYLMAMMTALVGLNGSPEDVPNVGLSDALALIKDGDEDMKQLLKTQYNVLKKELVTAGADTGLPVEKMCDVMIYAAAGHLVGLKGVLEQIDSLNEKDNLEIVLVGLSNNLAGVKIGDIDMGSTMDTLFGALNAYMAGLPTVMQAAGQLEGITFYYADVMHPEFISDIYVKMYDDGNWNGSTYDGVMDVTTMRTRTITAVADYVFEPLVGKETATVSKTFIWEVLNNNVSFSETNAPQFVLTGVYMGVEKAVAANIDNKDIPLSSLTGMTNLSTLLGDKLNVSSLTNTFTQSLGSNYNTTAGMNAVADAVYNVLNSGDFKGMCTLFGLFLVGDGMAAHPSNAGHAAIAAEVIKAYDEGHTVKDETIENVEILLTELYKLVETYGPEVAAQVWAQWEEYGYVDAVEKSIDELKTMLEERYTYYTETALPAIDASVKNLTAQKDALTAELTVLKAELEAKKAELAEVVNNTEIGDIYVPDIKIDVELGNNTQTIVPGNDCNVDGEDIEAELEAAVKDIEHAIAVIEALIADVEADIADMIALAEQIAAAVAELEKTMASVAEAAEDVEAAVNAVIDVIKNSDGVVDATIKSFEAARATAEAAVEVLSLTMATAEELMADVDTLIGEIASDAEALYNKFMNDLPGCIDAIPDEAKMLIGGTVLAVQQAYEANKEKINAALTAELTKLAEEYGINEESVKAELDKLTKEYEANKAAVEAELAAIEAKIAAEVEAKYAEIEAEYNAQIEAAKAEAAAKLAALEEELKGYQAELEALAEDAAEEVKAGIQAQIDRVNSDIATVKADLEHAVSHLENAAEAAYNQIVEEVTKIYEETVAALEQKLAELKAAFDEAVAALNQKLAELKAAYDKAVEDLTAAADKAIAELTEALNKALEELGKIGEELADEVNGILSAIRQELADAQKAIEEILKGNLAAIEELKNALIEMGGEAIVDAVNSLIDAVMALIEEATTADLVIDDDFKYVAIGDGSAASESYVDKLTAALNAEAAENGVDEIEMVNYAKVGNTVAAERANLSDVAGADLITVGFSNVEFMSKAIANMSAGADLDWAAAVGEENVPYVDQLLAEVAAKIAEAGIEGDYAVMANNAIEAYAYAAVLYATELPELVNEIHAVNPDAVIIIVGMYNPMDGVIINLGENATLDIGEYVDYLVKGVGVHGVAYSILTGNSIYVDAPAVQTVNTDTELGILDLLTLMQTGCASLYPSAVGDDYIAAEIADALNITYVKSEPTGLLGDADGNGVVNTKDAKLIQQYYIHAITENDLDLSVCDVDGNGVINTKDAKLVQQYYIHAISSFPVENV